MRRRIRDDTKFTVIHVGTSPCSPGGIGQVIATYLQWDTPEIRLENITTATGAKVSKDLLAVLSAVRRLVRACTTRQNVVVIVHLSQRGSFVREGIVLAICRALRLPAAAHLHGSSFPEFARRHPILIKNVLNLARLVLVLSDEARQSVLGLLPRNNLPVVKVDNPVKVPVAQMKKQRIVLFAGDVGKRKGVDVLLEAWELVRDQLTGWRLLIVGKQSAEVLISTSPQRSIEVTGPLSNAEVAGLQDRAAIAVLPSRAEAQPLFLLESMARGCACISTPVGQIAEMLDGGAGLTTPVGDSQKLADALRYFATSEQMRTSVGRLACQKVRTNYSEDIVKQILLTHWMDLRAQ